MTTLDNLVDYIFDGKKSPLSREFEAWARDSRRFRAFATAYSDKIRAKLRNVRDQAGMRDVGAELETAVLLLRDERFSLEYEKYAALKQRGPDFTVTWKTHTPFNVEVRRIRGTELTGADPQARTGKLMGVIAEKVGQMPPSVVNMLWLIPESGISEMDVARAAMTLRELAERKADDYFTQRRFQSAADFIKQYRRLSAIVLRQSGENLIWLNPIARHQVPPEILTAIRRLAG